MKLETTKSSLESLLNKASRLCSKQLTLPVLSCVYLELDDKNNFKIKSTNLDLGVELDMKVKNGTAGVVAVPANIILNTVSNIKNETISLEEVSGNLNVKSGQNSVLIKCFSYEDFPSIPKIDSEKEIKIKSIDLLNGLRSVWYSASNSNIKPELSSVYVYKDGEYLVFVSTDSFRLAEKKIYIKNIHEFEPILIPSKNVGEIIKIFEDYDGEMTINVNKNQIVFKNEKIYLVSRLIDGSFPDYKQIIPKNINTKTVVLKSDLLNSIKASSVFSDNLNQVKIKVSKADDTVIVEAKNNDVGEYSNSIKSNIDGVDIELNFNSRYITDCFQSIFSESLNLDFGGVGKPLCITSNTDKSFLYIVMPMNK